jgi:hypothetical protein
MFSVMALLSVSAHAEGLKTAKALMMTESVLTTNEGTPTTAPSPAPSATPAPVDCKELSARIVGIQSKLRSLQSAVLADYYDTQNVMNSWYYQLSANAGQTVYIGYGTYSVIRQSAETVGSNARGMDKRFNALNAELTDLLADFSHCQ